MNFNFRTEKGCRNWTLIFSAILYAIAFVVDGMGALFGAVVGTAIGWMAWWLSITLVRRISRLHKRKQNE